MAPGSGQDRGRQGDGGSAAEQSSTAEQSSAAEQGGGGATEECGRAGRGADAPLPGAAGHSNASTARTGGSGLGGPHVLVAVASAARAGTASCGEGAAAAQQWTVAARGRLIGRELQRLREAER
ncbi:unnamed protein product [Urochloa humidicola]